MASMDLDLPPIATLDDTFSSPVAPRTLPSSSAAQNGNGYASGSEQLDTDAADDSEVDEVDQADDTAADAESTAAAPTTSSTSTHSKHKSKPKMKLKPITHTPGHALLPLGRVQKIVKAHTETMPFSKEAMQLVAVATEEFTKHFAKAVYTESQAKNNRFMTYKDSVQVVHNNDEFNFLADMVPQPVSIAAAFKRRQEKEADLPNADGSHAVAERTNAVTVKTKGVKLIINNGKHNGHEGPPPGMPWPPPTGPDGEVHWGPVPPPPHMFPPPPNGFHYPGWPGPPPPMPPHMRPGQMTFIPGPPFPPPGDWMHLPPPPPGWRPPPGHPMGPPALPRQNSNSEASSSSTGRASRRASRSSNASATSKTNGAAKSNGTTATTSPDEDDSQSVPPGSLDPRLLHS